MHVDTGDCVDYIISRGDWVGIAAGLGRYSIKAYIGDYRLQKAHDLDLYIIQM